MTTSATNPNYYIAPGALSFSENANASSEYVVVSTYARTLMRVAPVKVDNVEVIGWSADLEYKQWQLTGKNTKFNPEYANSSLNIYVRLNLGDTSDALIFFTPKALDILGNEVNDGEIVGEPITPATATYAYIQIGTVTAPTNGLREIHYDSGNLGTAKGNTENPSGALAEMFKIVYQNATKYIQPQLDFVNIVLRDSLKLGQKMISAITDNITSVASESQNSTIPTVKAVVDFIASVLQGLENKFLSKEHNDSTPYKLTMREAEVTEDSSVGGDLIVLGDEAVGGNASVGGVLDVVGTAKMHGTIQSDNFLTGLRGWKIDRNGNLEAETGHFRSAIITDELRINRQQAQEGDTIFAENDQIELVTPVFATATPESGDNPSEMGWYELTEEGGEAVYTETEDTTVVAGKTYYYIDSYILDLKEKWDGYFTAQQYGNIIRGKINTLAAKNAGVSDYTGQEYQASQGVDAGGNKYYTSFFHVIATHNTNQALGVNQIQVVLYGDNEVPMSRNYPPCALMAIARCGCRDYADPSDPHYEDTLASIQRRQSLFMVASSDGHIIKLTGVNKPILEDWNIGATFGSLPDFIKTWPIANSLIQGRDYLYAQGIVVGDVVKVDIQGKPIVQKVDCGEWVDGSSTGTVMIPIWDDTIGDYVPTAFPLPIPASEYDNPDSPYIGHGIYLFEERNNKTLQWETHQVWHNGQKWETMQRIPVISGVSANFYEPRCIYRNIYWKFLEGDQKLWMSIQSSSGYTTRRASVNITLIPTVYFGSAEIPDTDIPLQQWRWTRKLQNDPDFTPADILWNNEHNGVKVLTLRNADMPRGWSVTNRLELTCIATLNDGINIEYIEWTIPI